MGNFDIDTPGREEMKRIIASLSPSERAMLNDPNFITADEADLILSDRSAAKGEGVSLDDFIRKYGFAPRARV
jgi:hypothetical protein